MKRILLKLSGEALAGAEKKGLSVLELLESSGASVGVGVTESLSSSVSRPSLFLTSFSVEISFVLFAVI